MEEHVGIQYSHHKDKTNTLKLMYKIKPVILKITFSQ